MAQCCVTSAAWAQAVASRLPRATMAPRECPGGHHRLARLSPDLQRTWAHREGVSWFWHTDQLPYFYFCHSFYESAGASRSQAMPSQPPHHQAWPFQPGPGFFRKHTAMHTHQLPQVDAFSRSRCGQGPAPTYVKHQAHKFSVSCIFMFLCRKTYSFEHVQVFTLLNKSGC